MGAGVQRLAQCPAQRKHVVNISNRSFNAATENRSFRAGDVMKFMVIRYWEKGTKTGKGAVRTGGGSDGGH